MADFLLVHGSCHGAWCWRDVIPALSARAHTVRAIDLPGSGNDQTPVANVTLERCQDAILDAIRPDTILVGHSWGGYPISAAAEAAPSTVRALIYLCAYVPISGLSMVEMRKRAPRQPLVHAIERSDDELSYTVDDDQIEPLFYHDCTSETIAYAKAHLRPQAVRPQATPLVVTDRFANVPKHYIRCSDDRTIPPEYQQTMTADWPQDHVHVMDSSHSPFFAHPQTLTELLCDIERHL
ncbi:alpha/beta fold hydrolase [Phaeobacter sp. NW0010-22]|uniref:alpha/beta fold hydrolase n=1 Tax=Phaeobacter sp. NW0010-22 TaxID=3135907 RepID=UPI0031086E3B